MIIVGGVLITLIFFIDWGKLAIDIIQRNAKIKITYEQLEGSIFRGFQIKNYRVKFSPTDSIYGPIARINYHLSPLRFRLPTLFDVVLIEPVINLRKKEGITEKTGINLPTIDLALRINLKNGRVIYQDRKIYSIEDISGLLFIDFLGTNMYLTTMNLSFYAPDYQLKVTSANLALNIDPKRIQLKSGRVKGKGFLFGAHGFYEPLNQYLSLSIDSSFINLDELGRFKGKFSFSGEIKLAGKRIQPSIRGQAQGVYLLDQFNFETNYLGDTIILSIFDGKLLEGTFSAQVKGVNLKDYTVELGFKNIAVNRLLNLKNSLLISGFLSYHKENFFGVLHSPPIAGLDIDSLKISGSYSKGHIFLDSVIIRDTLFIQGNVYPECSLTVICNRFNLKKLAPYLPIDGNCSGLVNLQGNEYNLSKLLINARLSINSFTYSDFQIQKCNIYTRNFLFKYKLDSLMLDVKKASYRNLSLDSIQMKVSKEKFSLMVREKENNLKIEGKIDPGGLGVVESLLFTRNTFVVKNQIPITFDIFHKNIGRIEFLIADGILSGSIIPLSLTYTGGQLGKLSELLEIRDSLSGVIEFILKDNKILLEAVNVNFSGLKNGKVKLEAEYERNNILLNNLTISDDIGQYLNAEGKLSLENSNLNVRFEKLRPWVFPFLKSFMKDPDCLMEGSIKFVGNLEEYKFSGEGEITQGSFTIPTLSSRFDSVFCKVKFLEDRILFESGTGCVSSEGITTKTVQPNIWGGGIIKLEKGLQVKKLSFDFSFKDAPLQYQSFAYGIGSGNFSLVIKDGITSYNGNIVIKEGVVPVEFGTRFEEENATKTGEWRMNLKLNGERNIWLRNRDADIEFGGEAYIIKEQGPVYVVGNLETRRGNFYWLNHILRITTGKVNFIPEETINPELDFWAELNTKEKDPTTNQEIKIILHCFGKIGEPIFEFFSEPPIYSEQDILTYLNLNITWRELESMKQGEYMGKVLPQSLLAWLESDVSRRLRTYTGLDYFRIEAPLFEPEEKTKLTVGKYVSRNLFVTYTYDITSFSNEFNVEYFIDDRNEIMIKRDETGEYRLQYQYRIRF